MVIKGIKPQYKEIKCHKMDKKGGFVVFLCILYMCRKNDHFFVQIAIFEVCEYHREGDFFVNSHPF